MANFLLGSESFLAKSPKLGNVALVTNNTGRLQDGSHFVTHLAKIPGIKLSAIFSPEHGFGSDAPDGEHVLNSTHPNLGVPIYSLYGKHKHPTEKQLTGIDAIIYDIQDLGVRFYTYISTLKNVLVTSAKYSVPLHILDRPNPLGGKLVEGPLVSSDCKSFVSHLSVPIRYGLTPAELAMWLNDKLPQKAQLTTWKCAGYTRNMPYEMLKIPWFQPSPSMPTLKTARFYPGTCLFEGLNLSEGRGTDAPFQKFGAPWVDSRLWLSELADRLPQNVSLQETGFQPTFSKFVDEKCRGIWIDSETQTLTNSIDIGLHLISTLLKTHPDKVEFTTRPSLSLPFFDYLAGATWVREGLKSGIPVTELINRMNEENRNFQNERSTFFLYGD